MTDIEQVELNNHKMKIKKDIIHLVEKYQKIFDWDVPEKNENSSNRLIFTEIRNVLNEIEKK